VLDKARVYVNNHLLDQPGPGSVKVKIWLERVRARRSLMAIACAKVVDGQDAMTAEQLDDYCQLVANRVLNLYGLDPEDKLLWYKLLCAADWPQHLDRSHELQEFRRRRLRRKSKPAGDSLSTSPLAAFQSAGALQSSRPRRNIIRT